MEIDVLKELLFKQIVAKNKSEQVARKDKPPAFYPSSIGKCMRSIVYDMLGYSRKEADPKGLMIMENGTKFHDRIEELLSGTDVLIGSEIPVVLPDLMVRGRCDSIIRNLYEHQRSEKIVTIKSGDDVIYEGPDSELMIAELKSINSYGFNKLVEYNNAKPEHIQQLHIYLHAFNVPRGVLIYENKDNQDLHIVRVNYDPKVMAYVLEKIQTTVEFYKRKELPNKEFIRSSSQCRYCDFSHYCWPPERIPSLDELLGGKDGST